MRASSVVPWVAAAGFLLAAVAAPAQQLPIYGCHGAMTCRTGPLAANALNDASTGSLLIGAGTAWGNGVRFGLASPPLRIPPPVDAPPAAEARVFHLQNVRLLPTPSTVPPPQPTPSPRQP